jgi:hypothetical protein
MEMGMMVTEDRTEARAVVAARVAVGGAYIHIGIRCAYVPFRPLTNSTANNEHTLEGKL